MYTLRYILTIGLIIIFIIYYNFNIIITWHIYLSFFILVFCLFISLIYYNKIILVSLFIFIIIFWVPNYTIYLEQLIEQLQIILLFTNKIYIYYHKLLIVHLLLNC